MRDDCSVRPVVVACAAVLIAMAAASHLGAQPAPDDVEAPVLWCAPDRAVVDVGETVTLTARVVSSDRRSWRFGWSAPAGRLEGRQGEDSADATWSLVGVEPGSYTASVEARDDAGSFLLCTIQVGVLPPPRGPRTAARSLLANDKEEEAGFGLYSYLLFVERAQDGLRRDLYLATLAAYLDRVPALEALMALAGKGDADLRRWNVTYLPVDADRHELENLATDAETLLARFQFDRAQFLLGRVSAMTPDHPTFDRGPYLVSSLEPLTSLDELKSPILIQDLSAVPPELAGAWLKAFFAQTSQIRYWEVSSFAFLRLQLRTGIAILGQAVPDIENALKKWISWSGQ